MTPHTVPSAPQPASPATLSRELADFLVELQIALHKHAIYPPDHPLVDAAVDGVAQRLWTLLADRSVLSVGVARRQLVIEGVATDADHPLLRELAQRLHRHHLGAIKFTAGVDAAEIADLLATLGTEPGRNGVDPVGTSVVDVNAQWSHVRLFPLTYGQLELVEGDDDDAEADGTIGTGGMRGGRAAQLWVGLARAALAAEPGTPSTSDEQSYEPVVLAKAIDDHQREVAYDQVIVGYMLQITDELRQAGGTESAGLQRRISRLVRSLDPRTLSTLLTMGGDTRQRRRFVLDAAQGLTVDAVLEVVKAAAAAERQSVSHSMLRMLGKLAQHAEHGGASRGRAADAALREHVARLVGEWGLDDPNPEAYNLVLEHFARGSRAATDTPGEVLACEPERIVQIAIEVDASGPGVERALTALLARGNEGLARLLDLLDRAPAASPVAAEIWTALMERDLLRELLSAPRPDAAVVERMIKRQGSSAAAALLDALEDSTESRWRERLTAFIVAMGDDVGALVARRLESTTPSLQRDLLAILGRLPSLPDAFDAMGFLQAPDPMTRREALRLAVRQGGRARDRALQEGLADPDPRVVFVAIGAAAEECPPSAIPVLMRRVEREELDGGLRAHAIRVIAAQRDAAHVPWLVQRVVTQSRWLRRPQLRDNAPELVAAVAALGAFWRADPRARRAIDLAAAAPDAEVRHALAAGAQKPTPLRANPTPES